MNILVICLAQLATPFSVENSQKKYGDLTRLDVLLDISSKKILNGSSADVGKQPSASPKLNLIFQEMVNFFSPDKSNYVPVCVVSLDVFESRISFNYIVYVNFNWQKK